MTVVCVESVDSWQGGEVYSLCHGSKLGCLHGIEQPRGIVYNHVVPQCRVENLQGRTIGIHQDQNINKGQMLTHTVTVQQYNINGKKGLHRLKQDGPNGSLIANSGLGRNVSKKGVEPQKVVRGKSLRV